MNDKTQLIGALRGEFDRWEELLSGFSDDQITAPPLSGTWSVKDVIAHLRAWQQVSIARMEAALNGGEPEFPDWLEGGHPESEEDREAYNARIYQAYRDLPWTQVHRLWRDNFQRFLDLSGQVPEDDLLQPGKFAWLGEYPLGAVLSGSQGHHREHREVLQ
jgi:hypothetical protein